MKKLLCTLITFLSLFMIHSASAQINFGFEVGAGLPHLKNLNNTLSSEGLTRIRDVNFSAGVFMTYDYDESLYNYINLKIITQSRNEDENNGTNMIGNVTSVGIGYRLIDKEKSALEVLLGYAFMSGKSGTKIQIRNQTPEPGDFITQLTNPSSTLLET